MAKPLVINPGTHDYSESFKGYTHIVFRLPQHHRLIINGATLASGVSYRVKQPSEILNDDEVSIAIEFDGQINLTYPLQFKISLVNNTVTDFRIDSDNKDIWLETNGNVNPKETIDEQEGEGDLLAKTITIMLRTVPNITDDELNSVRNNLMQQIILHKISVFHLIENHDGTFNILA